MSRVALFSTTLFVNALELGGLLAIKNLHSLLMEPSLCGLMTWQVRCLDLLLRCGVVFHFGPGSLPVPLIDWLP